MRNFLFGTLITVSFNFINYGRASEIHHPLQDPDPAEILWGKNYTMQNSSSTLKIKKEYLDLNEDIDQNLLDTIKPVTVEEAIRKVYQSHILKRGDDRIFLKGNDQLIVIEFESWPHWRTLETNWRGFPPKRSTVSLIVNDYHRVSFNEGVLKVKTSSGTVISVKDIKIVTLWTDSLLLHKDLIKGELSDYWNFWNYNLTRPVKIKAILKQVDQDLNLDNSVNELYLTVMVLEAEVVPLNDSE